MRDIANLIKDKELMIFADSSDFHNLAVDYARLNMFDCAIWVLNRGLALSPYSSDLLADKLLYSTEGGQSDICEEAYTQLMSLERSSWGWRAYSFTLDYYLDKANRLQKGEKREKIKENAFSLVEDFITYSKLYPEDTDRAYFEKAKIVKAFGGKETEESVLQSGCMATLAASRCALRLADILFDRGDYDGSLNYLKQCIHAIQGPQPGVNPYYVFLLSAMSKVSKLFNESPDGNYDGKESAIKSIYKDFNTVLTDREINPTYKQAAETAIKVIEVQTGVRDTTSPIINEEYI